MPALRASCRVAEGNLWHFCRKIGVSRLIFGQIGARMPEIGTLRPPPCHKQAWMVNAPVIC